MNLDMTIAEREPTRELHLIRDDLAKMVSPDFHPRIWSLINELENAMWEAGASEGWDMALAEHQ